MMKNTDKDRLTREGSVDRWSILSEIVRYLQSDGMSETGGTESGSPSVGEWSRRSGGVVE